MATKAERGFFRSAVEALVEARTRQANRYVNNMLMLRNGQKAGDRAKG